MNQNPGIALSRRHLLRECGVGLGKIAAEAEALAGEGPHAAERAAWTPTARAVLNLDEFVTKE